MTEKNNSAGSRYSALDGWRGISILLVLATHLMPLGPKSWQLNSTAGPMGMAIFFTLSGFLITSFLLKHDSVVDFLIRRFFRIVPLAWLYMTAVLLYFGATSGTWLAHIFFYANWPPMQLLPISSHIWSLCVEVQFYIGIALLVAVFRQKGLLLIPLLCLAFTGLRVVNGVEIAINTYYRIDEILAGSVLALVYHDKLGLWLRQFLARSNPFVLFVLLVIACHPESGAANYLRPYLAAMLVGSTLLSERNYLSTVLEHKFLVYIAAISYALYVIHPALTHTWLGTGEGMDKYIKRPLLFAVLFGLAHISTFYYEHKWIDFGKRLSRTLVGRSSAKQV